MRNKKTQIDSKLLEHYIIEFKNLDLEELQKRLKKDINVYTPKFKIDSMYKAYNIVKVEKLSAEAESIKTADSVCANLKFCHSKSDKLRNILFMCKKTGKYLLVLEAKDKCLNCSKCYDYKVVVANDNKGDHYEI